LKNFTLKRGGRYQVRKGGEEYIYEKMKKIDKLKKTTY